MGLNMAAQAVPLTSDLFPLYVYFDLSFCQNEMKCCLCVAVLYVGLNTLSVDVLYVGLNTLSVCCSVRRVKHSQC